MEYTNNKQLNLIIPPHAYTETSIALVWNKVTSGEVREYQIFVNGEIYSRTQKTNCTLRGLEPDKGYDIYICALLEDGSQLRSNIIEESTKPKSQVLNILDFGAVSDGKTLNTKMIQRAIDACPLDGMVYIPEGRFMTGALFLKSNMTLYVEKGGVLIGSSELEDYPLMTYRFEGLETTCYASLINTKTTDNSPLQNITIDGRGTIDANGCVLRTKELAENKGKPGRAICLRNTENVYLTGVTVRQSPAWCVHLIYCNHVSVNDIKIYTKYDAEGNCYANIANGDGLNPDSCSDVYIFNSEIASQDDCIAIKSGRNEEGRMVGIVSENIRVTNCIFKSGFGVAIGSEMSGGIRNVLVQDCFFEDVYSVGTVKAPRGRGGIIENIRYEDCEYMNKDLSHKDCEWFRGALYIDQFYSHITYDPNKEEKLDEGTAIIRDITFKNITLDTHTGNAIYLTGLPESPLQNITLENVKAVGKYGLVANNIRGLKMKNVSIVSRQSKEFILNNIE